MCNRLTLWVIFLPLTVATGCSCQSENSRFERAHPGKVKKVVSETSFGIIRKMSRAGSKEKDSTRLALDLSNDSQTNDALLQKMTFPDSLVEIDLSGTEITDVGVAELKRARNLEAVNLAYTKSTSAALKHLKEMPNLRWVIIVGPGIKREDVSEMTRFLNAKLPPREQLSDYDVGVAGPPPGVKPSDFNR